MLLARALVVALLLPACPAPSCPVTAVTAQATLVVGGQDGTIVEVHDGAQVPLVAAPQGGHILLVGAKLMGGDACELDATGSLRDPATGRVIGLDERPLVVEPIGGGWAQPQAALSSMPNVAVCPTAATTTSINGNPFTLELTVVAGSTTIATLSATVTPTCATGDTYCTGDCSR